MRRFLCSFLIAGLLALTFVPAAVASPPAAETVQVNDSFSFDDCGFQVDATTTGSIRFSTHFDANGNLAFVLNNYRLSQTYTNPATGASLTSPNVGPDRITFSENGLQETIVTIGLIGPVIIPGEGMVANAAGREVFLATFDQDGNLIDFQLVLVNGPHEDGFQALCDFLAS